VLAKAPNADEVLNAVWSIFRSEVPDSDRSLWRRILVPFGNSGDSQLLDWFDDMIKFAEGAIHRRTAKLSATPFPGSHGGDRS